MTSLQIGWIVAMSTGALIGAIAGILAVLARSSSKMWFNIVLGVFGAIMAYTSTFILGLGSGIVFSAIVGTAGAVICLIVNQLVHNRRRWAKW